MKNKSYEKEEDFFDGRLGRIDIIWNITYLCRMDCGFCCVDAYNVDERDRKLHFNGLEDEIKLPENGNSLIDESLKYMKENGKELTYRQKLETLEELSRYNVDIDFSGGSPLISEENFNLIRKASDNIRGEISVTDIGPSISKWEIDKLSESIDVLGFTYDFDGTDYDNRPRGYNQPNLKIASRFSDRGVKTTAQLPLTRENSSRENVENIYRNLREEKIDEILLMKLFPVGRNINKGISPPDYRKAIKTYRDVEDGSVDIRLQCALKYIEIDDKSSDNPCDMIKGSIGLTPGGRVLASPWAYGLNGEPLSEELVLGKLPEESIEEIYKKDKVQNLYKKLDNNYGHCKIFSFIENGQSIDDLFKEDPLYA